MTGGNAGLVLAAGAFGLLVGSFLTVVAARLPRGESVVRPRSRCPGCGNPVLARDNVPVVSWVLLRGRCRSCGRRISARYLLIEVATAGLFAGLAAHFGAGAELPAYLYLAALGVVLSAIDLELRKLPDRLTLPAYVVGVVLLGVASLAGDDAGALVRALLAMAAGFGFYFLLAVVYPAGMGFGDVKLAGVLGLFTGWLGWDVWAVGLFAAFLLGGLVSVGLLLAGRANRKSAVPFGPFMVAGSLLAVVVGEPIARAWLSTGG